ncbi:MAG: hypothetical protein KA444_05310 [Bacteroidia bacterium]|nr:hypothetical protein [Bacteroidia bacterium]
MNFRLKRLQSKTKQKQKLSQRAVALAAIFFLSVSSLCTMLFFNLNQPSRMQAKSTTKPTVIVVKDHELITEKSIPSAIMINQPASNAQTIYVRPVSAIISAAKIQNQ